VERLRASDLIVHAGDFVSAPVLSDLQGLGPPVVAVHGNMDDELLRAQLPEQRTLGVGEVRIGLIHDAGARAGREERLVAGFPGCEAVIYGHTHLPQVARHGNAWILNPGSPTERRRAPTRTMLLLEVDGRELSPRLVELV
jgi:putative phosphoesterase